MKKRTPAIVTGAAAAAYYLGHTIEEDPAEGPISRLGLLFIISFLLLYAIKDREWAEAKDTFKFLCLVLLPVRLQELLDA